MSPAFKSKVGVSLVTLCIVTGGVSIMEISSQAATVASTPEIIPTPTPTATHKAHKNITKPVVVSPVVTKPAPVKKPSHGHSGGSK